VRCVVSVSMGIRKAASLVAKKILQRVPLCASLPNGWGDIPICLCIFVGRGFYLHSAARTCARWQRDEDAHLLWDMIRVALVLVVIVRCTCEHTHDKSGRQGPS
jgi:hypothetical protein